MSRDQIQAEKNQLKVQYGELFDSIAEILGLIPMTLEQKKGIEKSQKRYGSCGRSRKSKYNKSNEAYKPMQTTANRSDFMRET